MGNRLRILFFFCLILASGRMWGALPVDKHYFSQKLERRDTLRMDICRDSLLWYDVQVCLSIKGMYTEAPLGKTYWRLEWYSAETHQPYLRATVRWGCEPGFKGFEGHFLQADMDVADGNGKWKNLHSRKIASGINYIKGTNTMMARYAKGKLRVYVGKRELFWVGETDLPEVPECITLTGNKTMKLWYGGVWHTPAPILPEADEEQIARAVDSGGGSPVGAWQFMDRDTDGVAGALGGKYTIVVMPHQGEVVEDIGVRPVYDIVYIDGAGRKADSWRKGMLKGHLYDTPFQDTYKLVWLDSEKDWVGDECTANITDDTILTLNFPIYKSIIRFVRLKKLEDAVRFNSFRDW